MVYACILYHVCSGGGARPRATEPFTKAVIRVVSCGVRVVANLQRLLSLPANSELVD